MVHPIHPQARIHPGKWGRRPHAPRAGTEPHAVASCEQTSPARPGAVHLKGAPRSLTQRCWQHKVIMHRKGIRSARITWWIRVTRLIGCILDPPNSRRAQINHANPGSATSRGQAASKGHDHPPRAVPAAPVPQAVPAAAAPKPRAAPAPAAAAGPAVRRRVRRGRPVRLRQPAVRAAAVRPAAGRCTYRHRHRQPAEYRAGQPSAARRRRRRAHHGVVSPAAGGGAHRPDRVPDPVRCAAGHPVLAWIRAHLPPGFTPAGTGVGTRSGSEWWTRVFALPAVPDVLTQRELVVLAVRSGSQSAIRVDAQVVWLPARPVAERVPPAARVLTVTPVFGFNPAPRARRLDRAFTVTDPATVARIAAVVNGLTRFPGGAFSCPAESGGQM